MAKHPQHVTDETDDQPVAETTTQPAAPAHPEHPARSGLLAALRNAGMTGEQAEAVVKALEDYLVAGIHA